MENGGRLIQFVDSDIEPFITKNVFTAEHGVDLKDVDQQGMYRIWRYINSYPTIVAVGVTNDVLGFRTYIQTNRDFSREVWMRKLSTDKWIQAVNP